MSSQAYQLIYQAIQRKQCMQAVYKDYERQMCPHTLGIGKSGEEQALFYQYAGGSSKGLGPAGSPGNWRCLIVSELSKLEVIEGAWQGGPNHTRPQTCVVEIDIEVAY